MDAATTNFENMNKSTKEVLLKYCIPVTIELLRILTFLASILTAYNLVGLFAGCSLPIFFLRQYDMMPVLNNGDLLLM
jgi:hypothetical protein